MQVQKQQIEVKDVQLNVENVEQGLQYEISFTPMREASGMMAEFTDKSEGKRITVYRWLNSAQHPEREQLEALCTERVEQVVNELESVYEYIARSDSGFQNNDGEIRNTNFLYEVPGLPAEASFIEGRIEKLKSQEIETEAVALPTA